MSRPEEPAEAEAHPFGPYGGGAARRCPPRPAEGARETDRAGELLSAVAVWARAPSAGYWLGKPDSRLPKWGLLSRVSGLKPTGWHSESPREQAGILWRIESWVWGSQFWAPLSLAPLIVGSPAFAGLLWDADPAPSRASIRTQVSASLGRPRLIFAFNKMLALLCPHAICHQPEKRTRQEFLPISQMGKRRLQTQVA